MNHSIDPAEQQDLVQVRAATIMLTLICQYAGLPALAWTLSEAGRIVGRRTAGPDAEVAADMGAWAGALDASVTATTRRCDGRTIYRASVDLAGSAGCEPHPVPVTITGIGVAAPSVPRIVVDTEPDTTTLVNRVFARAGLTEQQLDGHACVRCGVVFPPVSVPVGYVLASGPVFACDPGCPDTDADRAPVAVVPRPDVDPCDPEPAALARRFATVWAKDWDRHGQQSRMLLEHAAYKTARLTQAEHNQGASWADLDAAMVDLLVVDDGTGWRVLSDPRLEWARTGRPTAETAWRQIHAEQLERVVDGVTWRLDDLDAATTAADAVIAAHLAASPDNA